MGNPLFTIYFGSDGVELAVTKTNLITDSCSSMFNPPMPYLPILNLKILKVKKNLAP